jgi:hypothetical protein
VLPPLQRSGSRRIPATSADGYFRYIAESVVNADFTEAKRNRQDAKNKCCTFLAFLVCSGENSVGFSLDPVVFCQTRSVLQPEFVLGKLMLGRLIKAPDQLLHISGAVPAKQMSSNSAVCLSSFINDKENYDQET